MRNSLRTVSLVTLVIAGCKFVPAKRLDAGDAGDAPGREDGDTEDASLSERNPRTDASVTETRSERDPTFRSDALDGLDVMPDAMVPSAIDATVIDGISHWDSGASSDSAPVLELGAPCLVTAQCASSSCVDARCCVQSCAVCQNCTGTGGTCVDLQYNTEDQSPAGACSGTKACNGLGGCKAKNFQPCTQDSDCLEGRCHTTLRLCGCGNSGDVCCPGSSCGAGSYCRAGDNRCIACGKAGRLVVPEQCVIPV